MTFLLSPSALRAAPAFGLCLLAGALLAGAGGAGCGSQDEKDSGGVGGAAGEEPGSGPSSSSVGTGPGEVAGRWAGEVGGQHSEDVACDEATRAHVELSADDSNSMAAPALARELLRLGIAPEPSEVRVHEFLNYYDVPFASPPEGALLGLEAWMAPGETEGDYRLLFGVSAAETPRPAMNLVLSIDVSGSMKGTGLGRAAAAVRAIAGKLRQGDVVSLVTWSDEDRDILASHPVSGPDDPALLGALEELRARGNSNLATGLERAYELAGAPGPELRRVVLVSDGGANVAEERLDEVRAWAQRADASEIYLTGVGVGPALGYDDEMMDRLTDAGRGAYVFLDSEEEAARILGDRFDEVMRVAARDVSVTLELPSFVEIVRFSGEEMGQPGAVRRQHLAPGDVMSFLLSLDARNCFDPAARLRVEVGHEGAGASPGPTLDASFGELLAASEAEGSKTANAARKARALVAYAEALGSGTAGSPGDPLVIAAALAEIDAALAALDAPDPEIEEIRALLERHPSASPPEGASP